MLRYRCKAYWYPSQTKNSAKQHTLARGVIAVLSPSVPHAPCSHVDKHFKFHFYNIPRTRFAFEQARDGLGRTCMHSWNLLWIRLEYAGWLYVSLAQIADQVYRGIHSHASISPHGNHR
jgi:hypothetical protein